MEDLTLSFEAYNAHLVRGVIEATMPPRETAADTRLRAGTIIEMFKGFAPATALDSMIACQCIALQFVLMAAMRDLTVLDVDVKTQLRMRSTTVSLSRTLQRWIAQGKGQGKEAKAGNEARMNEAVQARAAAVARRTVQTPAPAPAQTLAPAQAAQPRPVPAPPRPPHPAASPFTHAARAQPGLAGPASPDPLRPASLRADPSTREAMLASTALAHGVTAAGLLTVAGP